MDPATPPWLSAAEASHARSRVRLLGARVDAVTEDEAVAHVMSELQQGRGGRIQTLNVDQLRRYRQDADFRRLAEAARLSVADGMPLVWASRLQGTPVPGRVTGASLVHTLSAAAATNGRALLLLGGAPGTAESTAQRLRDRHPGLRVVAYCPLEGFDTDAAGLAAIEKLLLHTRPDVVLVGLGSPKQEQVIERLSPSLPRAWWAGVGFAFSFASGAVPRAAPWVQRAGLEWLHRLAHEPKRLWRRYLALGLPFAARLLVRSLLRRAAAGEAAPEVLDELGLLREAALAARRPVDALLAAVLFVVATPLLLAAGLAVRLQDGGPALFRQRRCGLSGRPFTLLKVRTMRPGAEEHKSALLDGNEMTGPVFKMTRDPRVTTVGALLRRFSLDELPQLLNVLAGDMALVGPRPALPDEVDRYEQWQRRRLLMKPGITGLWQVSGRNEIDFQDWVRLDLDYIERWSPARDALILFKTIPAVLSGRGAR